MAKISLRHITKDDVNYFKKWWRGEELIKLTSGDLTPISDDEINQFFSDLISDHNNLQFMIEANNITIGNISLSEKPEGWFELQILIGEKNEWGKGYGVDAVNELLKITKKRSIDKIFLEVRPTNNRAISAYEKCGFKQIGTIIHQDNPNMSETLRMELI